MHIKQGQPLYQQPKRKENRASFKKYVRGRGSVLGSHRTFCQPPGGPSIHFHFATQSHTSKPSGTSQSAQPSSSLITKCKFYFHSYYFKRAVRMGSNIFHFDASANQLGAGRRAVFFDTQSGQARWPTNRTVRDGFPFSHQPQSTDSCLGSQPQRMPKEQQASRAHAVIHAPLLLLLLGTHNQSCIIEWWIGWLSMGRGTEWICVVTSQQKFLTLEMALAIIICKVWHPIAWWHRRNGVYC